MNLQSAQDIEKSAIKKLTWHIVPLMILLIFWLFLDRNNMAYAAMALEDSLGLTATAFGFASGIFFIGYFMFEIPSNAGTIKFWSAAVVRAYSDQLGSICHFDGVRRTPTELYICRFMLGVCEAGFFPSVVYYFTIFFRQRRTKNSRHVHYCPAAIQRAVGSPISGLILHIDNGWFGLESRQWLFILEGIRRSLSACSSLLLIHRKKSAISTLKKRRG